MKVYLVGGAVRDELLGLPVTERDWCVVGATPDDMEAKGFRPVGKDFPVFLHPVTNEEYALARTERKTSTGYHGFKFYTASDITIEQDLARRDLTINAIARDEDGQLIDPFDGKQDIENKALRHVSEAFAEDPVRILRAAKFAARFAHLGFRIDPSTIELMTAMVENGEASELVPDRVWKETAAALAGRAPRRFFEALRECGALAVVYPEIDALFGVPQPPKWHPEIDCGLHTLMVLEQAEKLSNELNVRFAALVHDLGKATTPADVLPSHHGHEQRGAKLIDKLVTRVPVPNVARDLGRLVAEFHTHCHRALELRSASILKLLARSDALRRPERFEQFLLACEADARGRTGFEDRDYPQADYLRAALAAVQSVNVAEIVAAESDGEAIAAALYEERLRALKTFKDSYEPPK